VCHFCMGIHRLLNWAVRECDHCPGVWARFFGAGAQVCCVTCAILLGCVSNLCYLSRLCLGCACNLCYHGEVIGDIMRVMS